jgi:DNA-binding response OmpR family regulator
VGNLLETYCRPEATIPRNAVNRLLSAVIQQPYRAKILVVDDEIEVVTALKIRLRSAGYRVVTAFDSAGATQAVIAEHPDLVILDIGMAGGDGHAVARRMTEYLKDLLVPIVFLTARTAEADRVKARSVGAADYITKPYTSERLLEGVGKALHWQREHLN